MKRVRIFLMFFLLSITLTISLNAFDSKNAKNITPLQAYHMLKTSSDVYMIDVRAQQEYQIVGHFENAYNFPFMFLSNIFAQKGDKVGEMTAPVTRYQFIPNKDFISELKKKFKDSDNLIFICKTSQRSHVAADKAFEAGFKNSYNVLGGFEGENFYGVSNDEKSIAKLYSPNYNKPGFFNGWKYYGLPYTDIMNPKYIYPPDLKK